VTPETPARRVELPHFVAKAPRGVAKRAVFRLAHGLLQSSTIMRKHWRGMIALFLVMAIGFGAAIITSSLYLAIVAMLGGFVLAFVMTIAWSRPDGSPTEHHAPGDRLLNDTRP
jgi:hypothetical protein